VRDEEYRLLLKACRDVSKREPRLQLSQQESPEESAVSISDELTGFLGAVHKDRERVRDSAFGTMQPLLAVYDIALLQVCDLSHLAWQELHGRTRLLWPSVSLPKRPSTTSVFYLLTSNLAQLLQAVRLLLLHGFEGQGRSMFRTFVELADLTLAVVAYEDVYRHYITNHDDSRAQYEHWRRHLSPAVIRRHLGRLDRELDLVATTAVPAEDVRDDTYRWFSLFSHVNMVAHLVSAYPEDLAGERAGPIAMLGEAGMMARSTFSRSLLYLWLFFLHLDRLLWERHFWNRFRGPRWRGRYLYRSRVFDTLFQENYNLLQGIKDEEGA